MTNQVPTANQARLMLAWLYASPVGIFLAGINYAIKNPTWLDFAGSCLAFAFAIGIGLSIRKFVRTNSLTRPSLPLFVLYSLCFVVSCGAKIAAHSMNPNFNLTYDLRIGLIMYLLAAPFFLFFRLLARGSEENP